MTTKFLTIYFSNFIFPNFIAIECPPPNKKKNNVLAQFSLNSPPDPVYTLQNAHFINIVVSVSLIIVAHVCGVRLHYATMSFTIVDSAN